MNRNKIACILQARISSTRLPGKILLNGFNKSLLLHTVERLKKSKKLDKIIIATTTLKIDDIIVDICKKNVSENQHELSKNKLCSWTEVECLGACVNAPMMQINQDYFEDLNEIKAEEIIHKLLDDELPKPGSVKNRSNTAPEKGKTTLLEIKNA